MPEIVPLKEFYKDTERLAKRFPNIEADLEVFKKALMTEMAPDGLKIVGRERGRIQGAERIKNLGKVSGAIYKAKRFMSTDLHATDRVRVIYAYECEADKCTLIEIYFKGDNRDIEDRQRIYKYFGQKA